MSPEMEKKLEVLQEEIMARSVPCDAELQELMHQIDMMVKNKKREWEKKMQALEVGITVRDQELATAQSKLDQKGQEVGLLQQKLDCLQKTKYEMAQNYDAQLQSLKAQFAKLTQSYEKLQLHQLKQNKAHRKGQGTDPQETPFQLRSLNQKLEEFKAKSREWDKQETLYQNHLVSLDAQRKLLTEKCNLFQKQAQTCQIQIGCQKLKQNENSPLSQCKMEHPGMHHNVFAESMEKNELFMGKLKSTVSEIAVSRNRLQEENLRLQQELKMYQRKCQSMEARLTEVEGELQSRVDLLNMAELECRQLRKEVAKMEDYKNKEDNQVKLQLAYAQCINELETKKAEMLILEQQHENQQKEINQITDRLYREAQSHRSEVERMRTEISDLTEELHQKEIAIATIVQKAALLERQLQMKLEIEQKMLGKQQTVDLSKKEHNAYSNSTHMLECKDECEHKELIKLPEDTETSSLVNPVINFRRNCASPAAVKVQAKEERPLLNENEGTAHPESYETFGHYRTQIPSWQGQGDIVNLERSTNLPPPRPSRDYEPMVDDRSPSPPEIYLPYYSSYLSERKLSETLLGYLPIIEKSQMPSPGTAFPPDATERFLQEEEKRARDFEKVLNAHIEDLQRQTENTVKKYTCLKQSRHR